MAGVGGTLNPGTLVGDALDTIESGMTSVAGPALLIGGAVTALTIGWKFAKRFVRG